jgi:hypothetical protein
MATWDMKYCSLVGSGSLLICFNASRSSASETSLAAAKASRDCANDLLTRFFSFPGQKVGNTAVAKWKKRAYLLSEFDVCSSSIVEIDCICNDPGKGKPGDGQNGVGSRGHDGGRRKTVNVIYTL